MTHEISRYVIASLFVVALAIPLLFGRASDSAPTPSGRQEVVFWHFWGGADREVVNGIVDRFNASQDEHYVRAIAMPGNNLDLKLFLAVTGGQPPDVVNQDDPILADWAERGALVPISEIATPEEFARLRQWLFPAAWNLGIYRQQLVGLCNGLDIRALYFNRTQLESRGLQPPATLLELDAVAAACTEHDDDGRVTTFGFLPNPKLLWSWGIVFGGSFYDEDSHLPTVDDPHIVRALEWMAGYGRRFGSAAISFRARDQSLPGKTFPLTANRYTMVVDGQWRVRDIAATRLAAEAAGEPPTEFGVCPLPPPAGGQTEAGWVNGNFFIVPRGAKNPRGAWAFMKFWTGFAGHEAAAARACAEGGWIPVSPAVVAAEEFQDFLAAQPLFRTFVELAASPHQVPRPNVPGAQLFDREVQQAASKAIYQSDKEQPADLLRAANARIQRHLDGLRTDGSRSKSAL